MVKPAIVYAAVNQINQKVYIGITTCGLQKRRRSHLWESRRQNPSIKFYRAIKKHGEENFVFSHLVTCENIEEAFFVEKSLIAIMKPEYNTSSGGEGNHGYKHTDKTKCIIASVQRGNKNRLGAKHSEEQKKKTRETRKCNPYPGFWKGKHLTEEAKKKISLSKKGIKRPPLPDNIIEIFKNNMRRAAKARRKPVVCLTDGNKFDSARDAAKFYDAPHASICQVCSGKRNSWYGIFFKWGGDQ